MGRNNNGQLGLGAADDDRHTTAAQLPTLGSGVVQVAADYDFSAALTAGGEVYVWGSNAGGQMANGECSMDTSGSSDRCRCDACLGQDVAAPTRVAALGTDTVQLALGQRHALALKQGGAVYGWGLGRYGGLGLGDTQSRLSPTEITGLGTDNAYIAAQQVGGMALKSDGRLFNWGWNHANQLGDGTTTNRLSPVELAAVGSDNAHVVGGSVHALLLKADGSVVSWGSNYRGQIGNGGTTDQVRSFALRRVHPCVRLSSSVRNRAPPQATPATVSALPSAAVQIAAGFYGSYAMLVDGSVWAWGSNQYGTLGDGTTTDRLSPVRIEGYGADTAMRLPPGGTMAHTMFVVAADGTAMGSGLNHVGQLGNGGTSPAGSVITAGAIPELGGGIVEVARGNRHTLVLQPDRTPPTLTAVSIASSNAAPSLAKNGDTVTLTITASEAIRAPTCAFVGVAGSVDVVGSSTADEVLCALTSGDADFNASTPGSCALNPQSVTTNDTELCTLTTGDADFDASTDGSCARAGGQMTHTCTYVDGVYAQTVTTGDQVRCTLSSGDADFDASTQGSCAVTDTGSASDTTLCALTSSEDTFDDTGTCVAADEQTTHTCTYVNGVYSDLDGDGMADTVDEPDSCTSATIPTVTCTYVDGVYSDVDGDGAADTVVTGDSCRSTTIAAAEVTTPDSCTSSLVPTWACEYVDGVYSDVDGDGTGDTVVAGDSCTSTAVRWTCAVTVSSGDTAGEMSFTIDGADLAGNTLARETTVTDGSSMTLDGTAPTLSAVSISSSNAAPSAATDGDTISLNFTSSEAMAASPACVFQTGGDAVTGAAVVVSDASSGAGTGWTCAYTVVAGDSLGAVSFTIDGADLAGNALVLVTTVTNGSTVTVEAAQAAPTLTDFTALVRCRTGGLILLQNDTLERYINALLLALDHGQLPMLHRRFSATFSLRLWPRLFSPFLCFSLRLEMLMNVCMHRADNVLAPDRRRLGGWPQSLRPARPRGGGRRRPPHGGAAGRARERRGAGGRGLVL
eukprot:COSAG04_NODE_43_length_31842_cov_15.704848_21_plen_1022_part_00